MTALTTCSHRITCGCPCTDAALATGTRCLRDGASLREAVTRVGPGEPLPPFDLAAFRESLLAVHDQRLVALLIEAAVAVDAGLWDESLLDRWEDAMHRNMVLALMPYAEVVDVWTFLRNLDVLRAHVLLLHLRECAARRLSGAEEIARGVTLHLIRAKCPFERIETTREEVLALATA
ncbi:hypothetical protein HYS28_02340 [Candidatus Uhrbacteria bacterium]|nr:hypothetical protein [Candidatus Uhrbacteria bacterium]